VDEANRLRAEANRLREMGRGFNDEKLLLAIQELVEELERKAGVLAGAQAKTGPHAPGD
jgi:hypothetical protein